MACIALCAFQLHMASIAFSNRLQHLASASAYFSCVYADRPFGRWLGKKGERAENEHGAFGGPVKGLLPLQVLKMADATLSYYTF